MGNLYKTFKKALLEDEDRPLLKRAFQLLVLDSDKAEFDKGDATLDAVLKSELNNEALRAAVRTQIIADPTRPFGVGDQIIQFFVEEGSRDGIRERIGGTLSGVLFEKDGKKETPIAFVTKADIALMISGEGFTVPLPDALGDD